MIRPLRHHFQHRAYLRNEHGIKKFAEMSLGQFILRVAKKSAFYREMNENLLVEKSNLRTRLSELYEQTTLEGSRFFSTRRELWANTLLTVLVIAAATFLGQRAMAVFVAGTTVTAEVLSWLLALLMAAVLTGGGMVACARLLNVLAPQKRPDPQPEASARVVQALLWGILLCGIEVILFGLADARRVAAATGSLHLSYVTATMLMPLVAGALRWHHLRLIDPYKSTLVLRKIESRLAQIDSILRQNEAFENNFYKLKSIEHWDEVNAFKTIKDNVNQRQGIVEPLGGHFSQHYDLFQDEARKRYTHSIREATSAPLRTMNRTAINGQPVGRKIGQAEDRPSPQRSEAGQSADYFSLQPVR